MIWFKYSIYYCYLDSFEFIIGKYFSSEFVMYIGMLILVLYCYFEILFYKFVKIYRLVDVRFVMCVWLMRVIDMVKFLEFLLVLL